MSEPIETSTSETKLKSPGGANGASTSANEPIAQGGESHADQGAHQQPADASVVDEQQQSGGEPIPGPGKGEEKSPEDDAEAEARLLTEQREQEEEDERKRLLSIPMELNFTLKYMEDAAMNKILMRQAFIYVIFLVIFTLYGYIRFDAEDHFAAAAMDAILPGRELSPTLFHDGAPVNGGTNYLKVFADLSNPREWHDWFESVCIPLFFDYLNRDVRNAESGPNANQAVVGGIRVRAFRVKDQTCSVHDEYYPPGYEKHCIADFNPDIVDRTPLTYASRLGNITVNYTDGCGDVAGLQTIFGEITRYPCGGHIVDFPLSMTFNEALNKARLLRFMRFVNTSVTRFVLVDIITYVRGIDNFVSNKLFVEITRGGGWIPSSRVKVFAVWTRTGNWKGFLAIDIILAIFVLYYWLRFFVLWVREARRTEKILSYLFDLWTFFDLVNLVTLVVNIVIHFENLNKCLELVEDDKFTLPYSKAYNEKLNYIMELYYIERYFIALNAVLSYLKLLLYFRLNNNLNILTRTIEATGGNLIGVLILFTLLVTAFALAGIPMYGTGIKDFRNIASAFASLFLFLLGKFDYTALRQEQRNFTFIYFWSFIVLCLFAMMNFITAILGSAFDETAAKTKVLPLHVQLRRARQRIKWKTFSLWLKSLCDGRRYRQDMIRDYIIEYKKSLLSADGLTQQDIEAGKADEPEYEITREKLGEIIPQTDVEYITDMYLDNLWEDMAEDYELENDNEEVHEERRIKAAYERGMMEGFKDVFLNKKTEISRPREVLLSGMATVTQRENILDQTTAAIVAADVGEAAIANRKNLSVDEVLKKVIHEKADVANNYSHLAHCLVDRNDLRARMTAANASGIQQLKIRAEEVEEATKLARNVLRSVAAKVVGHTNTKRDPSSPSNVGWMTPRGGKKAV